MKHIILFLACLSLCGASSFAGDKQAVIEEQLRALKPSALTAAISLRSPNIVGNPTDYEVSTGASWKTWNTRAEFLWERENGECYAGYRIAVAEPVLDAWTFEARTLVNSAAGLNQQTAIIGRSWKGGGVGVGIASTEYALQNVSENISFWIPLPGGSVKNLGAFFLSPFNPEVRGSLRLVTNFDDIHWWEGSTRLEFPIWEQVTPFIRGEVAFDHTKRFWKVKGGLEWRLQ